MRGLRLDRLTNRPYCVASALKRASRGDKIRTCGLSVPNAALYQTEPRLELFPQCFDSILDSTALVNKNLKRKKEITPKNSQAEKTRISASFPLAFHVLFDMPKKEPLSLESPYIRVTQDTKTLKSPGLAFHGKYGASLRFITKLTSQQGSQSCSAHRFP